MKYFQLIKIKKIPIICNIPHSSISIPPEYRKDFLISDAELKIEVLILADLYADQLFKPLLKYCGGIIAKFSRVVTDVERFEDDKKEIMSKVGMGVLYVKSEKGKIIRKISRAQRSRYLNALYRPYFDQFNQLIENCLKKFGKCLILDCHSFPSRPGLYELDQRKDRPDICLGTDSFHTPLKLAKCLTANFNKSNFTVKKNSPFQGTMVPNKYYKISSNVHSLMIEINKKLYLDEKNFKKKAGFNRLSNKICKIILECVSDYS